MPGAKTNEQHEAVKQTVRDLLQGVDDPRRVAALVTAVITHHAPELHDWAQAQLRSRHGFVPLLSQHPITVTKPAEAQFQAIFGVRPIIVQQPVISVSDTRWDAETTHFRVDPELGRLCVALHLAPALRVWVVLRQQVREQGGSGWIERERLREALNAQTITCSSTTSAADPDEWGRDVLERHAPASLHAFLGVSSRDVDLNGAGGASRQN